MAQQSKAKIIVPEIEQVCVIVRDVQKSMAALWEGLGLGPWNIYVYPASSLTEMFYRGKPAHYGMQLARAKWGIIELELIQPLEGESLYTDFLKEHGETVQHLGWFKVSNLAETTKAMKAAGFPCMMSGRTYRSRFAYFDTTKILGTMIEAVEIDQSVPARGPDRVWPQ
jgi:hypothetical protein